MSRCIVIRARDSRAQGSAGSHSKSTSLIGAIPRDNEHGNLLARRASAASLCVIVINEVPIPMIQRFHCGDGLDAPPADRPWAAHQLLRSHHWRLRPYTQHPEQFPKRPTALLRY